AVSRSASSQSLAIRKGVVLRGRRLYFPQDHKEQKDERYSHRRRRACGDGYRWRRARRSPTACAQRTALHSRTRTSGAEHTPAADGIRTEPEPAATHAFHL